MAREDGILDAFLLIDEGGRSSQLDFLQAPTAVAAPKSDITGYGRMQQNTTLSPRKCGGARACAPTRRLHPGCRWANATPYRHGEIMREWKWGRVAISTPLAGPTSASNSSRVGNHVQRTAADLLALTVIPQDAKDGGM